MKIKFKCGHSAEVDLPAEMRRFGSVGFANDEKYILEAFGQCRDCYDPDPDTDMELRDLHPILRLWEPPAKKVKVKVGKMKIGECKRFPDWQISDFIKIREVRDGRLHPRLVIYRRGNKRFASIANEDGDFVLEFLGTATDAEFKSEAESGEKLWAELNEEK